MYEINDITEYSEEIKKSKFIVTAQKVNSAQEAQLFFQQYSDPAANHNCWAYKIGNDYRFNDDGEPSGTAGKPILSAIEHAELTNIAVLIVRWFGGTKLGTGGLCRAYGGSASACLKLADKSKIIEKDIVKIMLPFDYSNFIYTQVESYGFPKLEEVYTENGLELTVEIPVVDYGEFEESVINATHGKAILKVKKPS